MKRRMRGWCIATLGIVGLGVSLTACGSSTPKGIGSDVISPGQSLFISKNFAHALDRFKAQAGGNSINLLEVENIGTDVQFTFADGGTAKEYDYYPNGDELLAHEAHVPGGGPISAKTFPISSVNPAVIDTLVADVKQANPGYSVFNLDLTKNLYETGGPVWSVGAKPCPEATGAHGPSSGCAQDGGQDLNYLAEIDGSSFHNPAVPSTAEAPAPGLTKHPSVRQAQNQAQKLNSCIQRAKGNAPAIQACVGQ